MDLQTLIQQSPELPNQTSLTIFFSIIIYAVIGTIFLPGKKVKGAVLKDGSRLTYTMNGMIVHFVGVSLYFLLSNVGLGLYSATIVLDNFSSLLSTAVIFSVAFTTFLIVKALIMKSKVEYHGGSNPILNFWYGIELNPHILGFEIKYFSYRPAFLLEHMIVLSGLYKQYVEYNTISNSMILYQIITLLYIVDCWWFEEGVILMFDIIEENFGFMLLFGDYVWIPFVFPVQIFYLLKPINHTPLYLSINVAIYLVGYWIFRGSNGQKKQFRNDPNAPIWGEKPRVIETGVKGKDLLISGWWGIARKINYTGDILIAIAWSLPCGFHYVMAFLYPIYLTILLLNRASRDDGRCREKYQKVWDQYCEKVKYIMIPYLY